MIAIVILFLVLIALDIIPKYIGEPRIPWIQPAIMILFVIIALSGIALVIGGVKGLFGKK